MQSSQADSPLVQEIETLCFKKLSIQISSTGQDLFEAGLLDSLSLVQLILELEAHFQIEFPMGELELSALRSVDEMASLIAARQAAGASGSPSPVVNHYAR